MECQREERTSPNPREERSSDDLKRKTYWDEKAGGVKFQRQKKLRWERRKGPLIVRFS